MPELTSIESIAALLKRARTIAVVGAHDDLSRPAGYVPAYLRDQGYRVFPVNPRKLGLTLFGEPVRATLAELDEPIDIVDIFRRSADVPEHFADIVAMAPPPGAVWLQLGIRNPTFQAELASRGIDVVADRCTLADHRSMAIGPITLDGGEPQQGRGN